MSENSSDSTKVSRPVRILPYIICLLPAVILAWYAWSNHKLITEYHIVRDNFRMTDAEMADFGEHRQEYLDAMKRQDEFAAAIALRVFYQLESGDTEGAKKNLATTISIYYRGHKHDGNTNVIAHIESYAATNAAISNAIYRRLE